MLWHLKQIFLKQPLAVPDAAVAAITAELAKGGSVSLVGFGTFSVKPRAARDGRNPRTGETIKIAASNTLV